MTESDWLGSADPGPMLDFLFRRSGASDRKLRLFCCACCRRVWHLLADERSRRAVEAAERFADGALSARALGAAASAAHSAIVSAQERWRRTRRSGGVYRNAAVMTADAAWRAAGPGPLLPAAVALVVQRSTAFTKSARAATGRAQAALLRDVVGDPFRPVTLDRSRLGRDVVALARPAYEQRSAPAGTLEPARLAVLADALEEAGCAAGEVLSHLRSGGPHVRGCWCVDLVLGKE